MPRPYSVAFKQKMRERLTGKDAVSANQLASRQVSASAIPGSAQKDIMSLPPVPDFPQDFVRKP